MPYRGLMAYMAERLRLLGSVCKQFEYGCMFCETGREDAVAAYINHRYPQIEALPVAQMKHKSQNGQRSYVRHIMLPGYIFFKTRESMLPLELTRIPGVFRVLYAEGREWQLKHENRAFAKWVYDCSGLIDVSKVYVEGEAVRIVDGPLRDIQGNILKVDKRNRNCLVGLRFNDNLFRVWMAFDYIQLH